MLTIYHHPLSPPAIAVRLTAEAAGTEYDAHQINLQTGEQRSDEFKKINPYSRVPAIKDGEFCLAETGAIMRYLAKRDKPSLYPSDIQGAALVDQWMDFCVHHVRTPVGRVQFNRVVAPMIGQEADENSIQVGLSFLAESLPIIDARLSDTPFLCGDSMTLADISLVGALDPASMCKIDLSPYKTLSKWLGARRQEAFYTNIHTHFGAELGF